jgi:Response regulators consisting of a CheY-like receiver domain and a winged-helix DNA-binding domain
MAKILLVEDDQSLREIYGIRLTAEGYEIVTAGDGEEALATAVREKPDLIISDVMMPKISGFDMLDILRSTPETKDIKVIMMTALSSDDQRERGERLGADRFLVKSQVGIEDVVNAVHEVLDQSTGTESPNTMNNQPDFTQPTEASNVFQVQQQDQQYIIPQNQPQAGQYTISQNQPQVGQYADSQDQQQMTQPVIQQQTAQQPVMQQVTPNTSNQSTYVQPNTVAIQQSSPQAPSFSQGEMTVTQNAQTPNTQNDAYSIDSVTDESGMNIKDQMDQILGGMGSI